MKKEKKEIRDVLMGRTVLDEDGSLTTLEPGMFRVPQGVMDGAGGVFLFGIAQSSVALLRSSSEPTPAPLTNVISPIDIPLVRMR